MKFFAFFLCLAAGTHTIFIATAPKKLTYARWSWQHNTRPSRGILYAPDRQERYEKAKKTTLKGSCPFCTAMQEKQDTQNLVLGRYEYNVVLLNLFPYAKGQLLIVPLRHVKKLEDLTLAERTELMELTSQSCSILEKTLSCDAFNLGINMGKAAGASVPDHLHMNIVPRLHDDLSFIQLIGNTDVICWDLMQLFNTFKPHFDAISTMHT